MKMPTAGPWHTHCSVFKIHTVVIAALQLQVIDKGAWEGCVAFQAQKVFGNAAMI